MSTSTASFSLFPPAPSFGDQKRKVSSASSSMFDLSLTNSKPSKPKKDEEKKDRKAEKRKSMELMKTLTQKRHLARASQDTRRDDEPQECAQDFDIGRYPVPKSPQPHPPDGSKVLQNLAESAERWKWFAKSRKSSKNSQAAVAVDSPSPRTSLYPSDRPARTASGSSASGNVQSESVRSSDRLMTASPLEHTEMTISASTASDPPVSASLLEHTKMTISASTASDATADDDASSCYSRTSSTSSVYLDPTQERENKGRDGKNGKPYSLICPVDAGVFDETQMLRKFPTLNIKKSMTIKQSRDKPLPPEPPMEVSPLLIRNMERNREIDTPPVPAIPQFNHSPPPQFQLSTVPSLKDLDALNSAFQRMTTRQPSQLRFDQDSPTLDEAAEELEHQLSTIPDPWTTSQRMPQKQSARGTSDFLVQPLQISRGKMDMLPSRSPPVPSLNSPGFNKPSTAVKSPGIRTPKVITKKQHAGSPPRDNLSTNAKSKSHRRRFSFSFGNKRSKSQPQPSGPSEKSNSPPPSSLKVETRNVSVESVEKPVVKAKRPPEPASCGVAKERNLRLQLLPRLKTDQLDSLSTRSVSKEPSVSREPEKTDAGNTSQKRTVEPKKSSMESIKERSWNGSMAPDKDCAATSPEDSIYSHVKTNILPSISNINVVTQPEPAEKELYIPPGPSQLRSCANSPPEGIAELDGGAPSPRTEEPAKTDDGIVSGITVDAAEAIILRIMQNLDSLQDLFTTAILNRGFYQVFKYHELELIKNTLFRMSPAAWELRQMSPPWGPECHDATGMDAPVPEYTPSLYLNYYSRDLYTMVALKSLILVRCESFLRQDTVNALAGLDEARAAEIDEAFWRVWTFCRIFGCGKNREDDIKGQMDWLNGGILAEQQQNGTSMVLTDPFGTNTVLFDPPEGFSQGNEQGLSSKELYDMTEVWTCLGVLMDGFHGKCDEARKYGVFDDSGIKKGDIGKEAAMLEEWTYYVQSLGPSAILTLATINPTDSTEATFTRAQSLGWTSWSTPGFGMSRSSFLKDAVSRAYESRLSKGESPGKRSASPQATVAAYFPAPPVRPGRLSDESDPKKLANDFRERRAALAEELQQKNESAQKDQLPQIKIGARRSTFVDERPISKYHDVMKRFEAHLSPSETSRRQSKGSGINTAKQIKPPRRQSEQTGITVPKPFDPPRSRSPRQFEPSVSSGLGKSVMLATQPPQVRDPVDMAMSRMVDDLGFSREDSKRALKVTDTGDSINVDAAVMMLVQERRKDDPALQQLEQELGVDMDSMNTFSDDALNKIKNSPNWRWA